MDLSRERLAEHAFWLGAPPPGIARGASRAMAEAREIPGIKSAAGALSNNPKDAIGRTKVPLHLIPPPALVEIAKVMGLGAAKYGAYNWRDASVAATVYVAAAQRHLLAFLDGETVDPETGETLHLAHVAACCAILLDAMATGNVVDDRPKAGPAADMMRQPRDDLHARMAASSGIKPDDTKHPPALEPQVQAAMKRLAEQVGQPVPAPKPFLWYLATPYTASPDGLNVAHVRAARALAKLLRRGVSVFCPIAHSHEAGKELPQDHDFWMAVDRPFMDRCDGLLVLKQPGWGASRGIAYEARRFTSAGKPVLYADEPITTPLGWDYLAGELARIARGVA